jgi:hypothetical protein
MVMANFLISVERNESTGVYMACFLHGQTILLNATNYQDAVLEADMLEPDFEVGYN